MKLSEGVVKTIVNGGRVDPPFVLQVLRYEKIGLFGCEQYSLTLSDGVASDIFCILSQRLNPMIHRGQLPENTVICITDYIVTSLPGGKGGKFKMLNITGLGVVAPGHILGRRIGNPVFAKWRLHDSSVPNPELKNIPQLSKGALSAIVDRGDQVESPILQILARKKIYSEPDIRYGLLLSDGVSAYSRTLIVSGLLHMIHDGFLNDNTIICLKRYISTLIEGPNPGRVIILMDIEVLVASKEVTNLPRIGNPKPLKGSAWPAQRAAPSSKLLPSGGSTQRRAPCVCPDCGEQRHSRGHFPEAPELLELLEQEQLDDVVLPLSAEDWAAPLSLMQGPRGLRLNGQPPSLPS